MKLRKDNQNLSEENNLLKLKIDILLDMVMIVLESILWMMMEKGDFNVLVINCEKNMQLWAHENYYSVTCR